MALVGIELETLVSEPDFLQNTLKASYHTKRKAVELR